MSNNQDKIKSLKIELVERYQINSDRDLINQLNIVNEEDKNKLYLWIRYQCVYSYKDGYNDAEEEIKERILKSIYNQ